MKKMISLLRKVPDHTKMYIEYEKLKRKKGNSTNNKMALVVKHSDPYVFKRYFYILLKFFSLEGFDIYFPEMNYNIFRRIFKIKYLNLIYSEGLLIFGKMPREYELVIELNDNNLSPDYFTPLMQNIGNNAFHVPMTMHPLFYHREYWNKSVNVANKRKRSIFMAGSFNRTNYSNFIGTPFNMESRVEVYDYLLENNIITPVKSFDDLKGLLNSSDDNVCIIVDSFQIDMDELRGVISQFNYFLALPGVIMPHSHNIIEALSVGTIPIIHEEYAKLMTPRLEHMNNAIVYDSLEDLSTKIELAYSLDEESLLRLRNNIDKYYQENLTPKSVIHKITSKEYDRLYLQAEHNSVKILENSATQKYQKTTAETKLLQRS